MRKLNIKSILIVLTILLLLCPKALYADSNLSIDKKSDALYIMEIIDNRDNLDEPVKRSEFAKMIVKMSDSKDKISGIITESVCNDVSIDNPYAGFIKEATDKGHMFLYLGGYFKPDEYVIYSDLSRAMLSLLGYTSEDFRGNQVIGRNSKFESLKLNEGIDKGNSDVLTKSDVIIGMYNTLLEYKKDGKKEYGLTVFDKISVDKDNTLNTDDMINVKVEGPFMIYNPSDVTAPFEITPYNVYLNGLKSDIGIVKEDILNYGYAIFYLDLDREYVYSYTERDDVEAPIKVNKGYIQDIFYSANDLTTPYRVDIESKKYSIASEEMKFAFSPSGSFKIGDYIIYICNKMNDKNKAYLDDEGNVVHNNDDIDVYSGSIINAFIKET